MTYIIAEPCIGICDTACVEVCPVDCIHFTKDKDVGDEAKTEGFDPEGKQLFIDPEEWNKFVKMNYEFFGQQAP